MSDGHCGSGRGVSAVRGPGRMIPSFCGTMGLTGWMAMLVVWTSLVALAVWAIARLFPDRPAPNDHNDLRSNRS